MQAPRALSLLISLVGLTSAAPTAEERQFQAQLHFNGAAGSTYTISAPTDTTIFYTSSSLAVDQVCLDGGATCTVDGVDGAKVTVVGANCVTVAPPQAIVWGSCLAL